ncbi:hypothetical protein D7X33_05465 [Butyricicoccus sp. 1XD8-22]|nr:hypothetical protein D7X33_05465 [Butyricicoccus sp. 1XD8-22]
MHGKESSLPLYPKHTDFARKTAVFEISLAFFKISCKFYVPACQMLPPSDIIGILPPAARGMFRMRGDTLRIRRKEAKT